MSEPAAKDQALYMAALEAAIETFKSEYGKARLALAPLLKDKYINDGNDRQLIMLPDGEVLDHLVTKAGTKQAEYRKDFDLLEWCREHFPSAIEEYVEPEYFTSLDVIAAIRDKLPGIVRERVRPATAAELAKEVVESGGYLEDKRLAEPGEARERQEVAAVKPGGPNGSFAFSGERTRARRERLMDEMLRPDGQLRGLLGFGPPALPAPEGGSDDHLPGRSTRPQPSRDRSPHRGDRQPYRQGRPGRHGR